MAARRVVCPDCVGAGERATSSVGVDDTPIPPSPEACRRCSGTGEIRVPRGARRAPGRLEQVLIEGAIWVFIAVVVVAGVLVLLWLIGGGVGRPVVDPSDGPVLDRSDCVPDC
jgi:hypothetical protein